MAGEEGYEAFFTIGPQVLAPLLEGLDQEGGLSKPHIDRVVLHQSPLAIGGKLISMR